METGNARAGARLLTHARQLAAQAPLCGIPTADVDVANHCIAQSIAALAKRGLSPIYFLEETDYLWDVFTDCREKVARGYDATKGPIGCYAWKCARTVAVRLIATHDTTRLYGSCANVRAPEMVFHGAAERRGSGEEYDLELTRNARGQLCQGIPDAEEMVVDGDDLETMIAILDPRSREIMRHYYRDGLGLREIGTVLGVSKERVNQLRHKALEKMRGSMMGKEE